MKICLYLMLTASGLASLCPAQRNSERWSVREEETIRKTLRLSGTPMRLLVENIEGYVHVTATSGSEVRVVAHKTIRAETDADLQQAKSEVMLDMKEGSGSVSIEYNAPWNCRGQNRGCQDHERRFYTVIYDLDIEVPREARPVVSTVNRGDVTVEGTTGDFDIGNVNGSISVTNVAGSGDIHTVNGPITARFQKNPAGPSSFRSVNGALDVYFQPDFSADLRFKTLNGQIYSDFEVTANLMPPPAADQRNGKFVYRSNGMKSARAGRGGPELTFDTLNGNIRLHRTGNGMAANE
jgi:DUF4097 and DUF4098 domain-containing protein YvlB